MNAETKYKLGSDAYEKLREVIKQKTSYENLTEENINVTKEAVSILMSWLEAVYLIDRKQIIQDEEGLELNELFKTT